MTLLIDCMHCLDFHVYLLNSLIATVFFENICQISRCLSKFKVIHFSPLTDVLHLT